MSKNFQRTIIILVLIIFLAVLSGGVFFVLWRASSKEVNSIESLLSLEISYAGSDEGAVTTAYIQDRETGIQYSILPYAHRNGVSDISVFDKKLNYVVSGITYEFDFNKSSAPKVVFDINNNSYTISDDGEYVVIKDVDGWWPWKQTEKVCLLPQANSFYSPIKIENLKDYAILVLNENDQEINEYDISVYVLEESEWRKINFELPDGTYVEELKGYVRRHFETSISISTSESIGDMEVCMITNHKTILYRTTYLNGSIKLSPIKEYENGIPFDWKF